MGSRRCRVPPSGKILPTPAAARRASRSGGPSLDSSPLALSPTSKPLVAVLGTANSCRSVARGSSASKSRLWRSAVMFVVVTVVDRGGSLPALCSLRTWSLKTSSSEGAGPSPVSGFCTCAGHLPWQKRAGCPHRLHSQPDTRYWFAGWGQLLQRRRAAPLGVMRVRGNGPQRWPFGQRSSGVATEAFEVAATYVGNGGLCVRLGGSADIG